MTRKRDIHTAKWNAIERLYACSDKLMQQARLSRKAVYPNHIQRQNVSLSLKVFSDYTVAAYTFLLRLYNAR
jgi:hypothetical protein